MTEPLFTAPDDVAALASLTATQESAVKWPKLLANMVDVANSALRRDGLPAQQAGHYARVVMLALGQYCGGVTTYIPTGDALRRALRDDAIFRRCGKETPVDLAREYGLSEQRVYQIVGEQLALRRKAVQPDLFSANENAGA